MATVDGANLFHILENEAPPRFDTVKKWVDQQSELIDSREGAKLKGLSYEADMLALELRDITNEYRRGDGSFYKKTKILFTRLQPTLKKLVETFDSLSGVISFNEALISMRPTETAMKRVSVYAINKTCHLLEEMFSKSMEFIGLSKKIFEHDPIKGISYELKDMTVPNVERAFDEIRKLK